MSFEDSVVCLSVGEYLWPLSKAGPRMGLATAPSQRSHGLCASPDIFIVSGRRNAAWRTASIF